MVIRRPVPRILVAGLLALLLLACAQQAGATLGILWRAIVLSWDSPATQLQDEAASQGVACADGARQAREIALLALPPRRVPVAPEVAPGDLLWADASATRSPPAPVLPAS